ncbi:hypothetical protein BDK92_4267 [Micromonospora pisi]|uniref:Outer membrane channel protein CpnT-like N-terminal domain-containing protein n=1 Tax=Micromonospora pisi TaxID=589240 RepID=A0A495JLR1_9ACTN|nr:hypothetical protein [Micromonospora pisi]RKR89907.1 hypothetical protein BDK92_4267 [Micromonospora pisi]
MSDEYVQRYQHVSHEELYRAVHAGDADQVETLASKWSSLKTTVDGLARSLREDLDALDRAWTGAAGEEFQRRINLVVSYSNSVATGMGAVNEGLSLMAGPLRTAQKDAESPEETDDHDQALGGAAKGAIFGPAGMVVGGFLGHQQDKEEQERAHQRMVAVVARLAAAYDLSAYDRLITPPVADPETPDTVNRTPPNTQTGPGATTPTRAPESGSLAQTGIARAEAPQPPARGPVSGPSDNSLVTTSGGPTTGRGPSTGNSGDKSTGKGGDTTGNNDGTSLAGAGLAGGWATGASGMAATAASAPPAGGSAGLFAGQSMATPPGGVLGSGTLAASGTPGSSAAARPGGGSAEGRSTNGAGRAEGGSRQGTSSAGERSTAGDRSAAGRPGSGTSGRPGMLGGSQHGQPEEDEGNDRLTWLTEDDMVWRDDESAAPPVLGSTEQ